MKKNERQTREYTEKLMERMKDFMPHAAPELQAAVGAVAARHGRSLTYWEGMLYGLALSLHAQAEVLPPVLGLEQEPPEVQAQVAEYAAGIWARLDTDDSEAFDVSVNPELVGTRAQAEDFLSGVAAAIQLAPEPLRMLTQPMTVQALGENVVQTMMLVMSFAHFTEEWRTQQPEWEELQQMRQGAMQMFEQGDAEAVAGTVQLMLLNMDEFFGFVTVMEKFGIDPKMLRGSLGARTEPVQREGRKIRPNEPCPCGSGKKYKKCHGAPGAAPLP